MKAAVVIAILGAGCGTFGVDVVEREVKASHPADGIDQVTATLSVEDAVTARGGAAAIDATAEVVAWIEPGASAALLDRVTIAMERQGAALAVDPDIKGAASEEIVLTDLDLLLPSPLSVDLAVSHGHVSLRDLAGAMRVVAPDSAVAIDRTGPVDVEAEEVTARIGAGGRIAAGSGPVTVDVLGADFDQLLVTTDDGPVVIHLPPGGGWDIDVATAGEGTVSVSLGGLTCGGSGVQTCQGIRFGEGGPLIRVESGGGAITVNDLM